MKMVYKSIWSKNDTILTMFCEKFGVSNLVSNSFSEENALETIANEYIGSVLGSLKQQMGNFRYLLTNGADGLSDCSLVQKEVNLEFELLSKNELKNICLEIMGETNVSEVYANFKKIVVHNEVISSILKNSKVAEKKRISYNEARKKEQIEYAAIRLGINPKKLIPKAEYLNR